MDEKKTTIWPAAAAIEEVRISSRTWKALLATDEIKPFVGEKAKGLRIQYMERLQSDDLAAAAFAEPKAQPVQVIRNPHDLTTLIISPLLLTISRLPFSGRP